MFWLFRNRQNDDILERAAAPLWKVEPPRPWPDPPVADNSKPYIRMIDKDGIFRGQVIELLKSIDSSLRAMRGEK